MLNAEPHQGVEPTSSRSTGVGENDGHRQTKCPCCGAMIGLDGKDRPLVYRNRVSYQGQEIALRPSGADILNRLIDAYPRTLTFDHLIETVWSLPDLEPDNAYTTLKVHVSMLRKSIADMPFRVSNVWGVGYRLTLPGDAA